MKKNIQPLLLIILVYSQSIAQNNLTFEQVAGTTSWTENGLSWSWSNGSDEIQTSGHAKNGNGYGRAKSNSNSKLVFSQALNLNSIWVKFNGGITIANSTIKGFDANNNVIYQKTISNQFSYQSIYLNWTNVRSISFEIPYELMPDPFNPSNYIQSSFDAFYDDLNYSIYTAPIDTTPPSMFCFNPAAVCNSYIVPDYKPSAMLFDDFTPYSQIVFTQSIPIGTAVTIDSPVTLSATDMAGNTSTCTIQIKINSPTYSTQNITANTSYKDPLGQFHYASGNFNVVVPNSKGCDSTININLTINQQLNVLNFDVAPNLTTWTEDAQTWSFVGGTDKTGNGVDAKNGFGYGKTISGSTSKLQFPSTLNLQKIWVKFPGGQMAFSATLYGYNQAGSVIFQQTINQNVNYQQLTLNWTGVSSIGFSVPFAQMTGPGPGGIPQNFTYPVDLYFDDLEYTFNTPTILCPPNQSLCVGGVLPNYQNLVTISGTSASATLIQTPSSGTAFSAQTTVNFSLTDGANSASCAFNVLPLYPTSSTNNISVCDTYTSPLGGVYTNSQTIIEKVPNRAGCDSTITINLTVNKSSTRTVTINAVNQYTHTNGITYYFSNTVSQILQSPKGCDSTITTIINITSNYLTLDFNESAGTSAWNEDGYAWSGWAIDNTNPKSGIGNGRMSYSFTIDPQTATKLVAERPMSVQGFWLKTQNGNNIIEAKVFGFDNNDVLINQLTIPLAFFNDNYQFLPLNWTQIKRIAIQYRINPPVPTNPTIAVIFIDELKYKIEADVIPPVITNCPTSKAICVNTPLPSYVTEITATDNSGFVNITQSPAAGTAITSTTEVTITVTDNSQNSSTCKFNVSLKQNTSSTITISRCVNYISPAGNILTTTGVYHETIPNAVGCDSLITINLTIISPSTPTGVSISKNNICSNETITLTASCLTGIAHWSSDMYFIQPFASLGTGSSVDVKPSYNRKYYVRCEGNNCTSNGAETPLIIVDKVSPAAPIIFVNNSNVCSGANTILTSSACADGTVKWFNGSTSSSITVNPTENKTYKAVCFSNSGCSSDSAEVAITVKSFNGEKPTISLVGSPKTCSGGDVQIQVTGCSSTYAKFSNGDFIYTAFSPNNIGHFYPTKTTYYKAACTDFTCQGEYSDSIKVVVVLDSIKAPNVTSIKPLYCQGENITMSTSNCDGTVTWFTQNALQTNYYYGNELSVNASIGSTYQAFCSVATCKSDTTVFSPKVANTNWITNVASDRGSFCDGGADNVRFTLNEVFPSGNIFNVELSDKDGNFTNPTIIGTSTGANTNVISVMYPTGLTYGSNYFVRVVPSIAPDGVSGYTCFQSTHALRIGVNIDVNFNKNNIACENTTLEISIGISDLENDITWYKDGIKIDSLNQSTRKSIFKRFFSKKSDEGFYSVKIINGSEGCTYFSNTYNNTISAFTAPPSIKDTTIFRGNSVVLTASGCTGTFGAFWYKQKRDNTPISSLIASNTNNYHAGFGPNPGGISKDTTFYVACLDGCFSERVPVKINIVNPINAPNPPTLAIQNNDICAFSGVNPIITATGCAGSVRWTYDQNFGYISEIDTSPPFQYTHLNNNNSVIYADCMVNGVLSNGASSIAVKVRPANNFISYRISPYDEGYEDYDRKFTTIAGSDVKLNVEKPYPNYCSNGIFQWHESVFNGTVVGTGETYTRNNVTNNVDIFVSCLHDGCTDYPQKTTIVVDSNNPNLAVVNNNQSICGGGNTIIYTTGCTNGVVNWYDAGENGNLIFTGNNYQTPTYSMPTYNQSHQYWVSCTYNNITTPRKSAIVIVSPIANIPITNDQVFNCNSFNYVVSASGCNNAYEYVQWYAANGMIIYNYYGDYTGSKLVQENFTNAPKTYYVTCKNRNNDCESIKKAINVTFDCTAPAPPVINATLTQLNTATASNKPSDTNAATIIEVCAGQEVILSTNSCLDGGVFWSDGGVGNYRKIYPTKNIAQLTASCTNINYVTSNNSNSISIQIKDTPKLTITNPPTSNTTVNLTVNTITTGSYLPINTQLSYFLDSQLVNVLASPQAVAQTGTYYIKATAPNTCFDVKPVMVVINSCNSSISLTSPIDDYSAGVILKKSNNVIEAVNKQSNTAKVTYQSGKGIILNSGFEAKPTTGGYLIIKVEGCN